MKAQTKIFLTTLGVLVFLTGCASTSENIDFLKQGQTYISQFQYSQALTNYKQAIETNPSESTYYILAADIYAKKGDPASALDLLNQGFANTNSVEVSNKLAELSLLNGKLEDAKNWYTKSLELDPQNIEAVNGMIKYRALVGEFEEITKLLDSISPDRYDSDTYIIKAVLNYENNEEANKFLTLSAGSGGENLELIKQLKTSIDKYSLDKSIHNALEISYVLINEQWYELSNFLVQKTLTQNQFYETAHIYSGLINLNRSNYAKSIESFLKVLEINPENPDAKIFLIQTYFLDNNVEKAAELFAQLISKDIEFSAQQLTTLTEILFKNEKFAEIDQLLTKYQSVEIPAQNSLYVAQALLEAKKFQQSLDYATKALSLGDTLPVELKSQFLSISGYANFNLEKKQLGLDEMKSATEQDKSSAFAQYYYGKALHENNDITSAEYLNNAIEFDLDGFITQKAQAILDTQK